MNFSDNFINLISNFFFSIRDQGFRPNDLSETCDAPVDLPTEVSGLAKQYTAAIGKEQINLPCLVRRGDGKRGRGRGKSNNKIQF